MKKLKKVFVIGMLLVSLPVLAGCATSKTMLYPIKQTDIILLDKGDTIIAPSSGAFLSDFFIDEVMKSKVEN